MSDTVGKTIRHGYTGTNHYIFAAVVSWVPLHNINNLSSPAKYSKFQ